MVATNNLATGPQELDTLSTSSSEGERVISRITPAGALNLDPPAGWRADGGRVHQKCLLSWECVDV